MSAAGFAQIFREEHRAIRDTLLDLIQAFRDRDGDRIGTLLTRTAELTGPHFRYEEEALYPALVEIFGEEYIEKLLGDHDRAIGTAHRLVELAGMSPLRDEDVSRATRFVRSLLPHVSDCEGLSIMVERLPEKRVQAILEARTRSNAAGLDLIRWSTEARTRTAVLPA